MLVKRKETEKLTLKKENTAEQSVKQEGKGFTRERQQ